MLKCWRRGHLSALFILILLHAVRLSQSHVGWKERKGGVTELIVTHCGGAPAGSVCKTVDSWVKHPVLRWLWCMSTSTLTEQRKASILEDHQLLLWILGFSSESHPSGSWSDILSVPNSFSGCRFVQGWYHVLLDELVKWIMHSLSCVALK